MNEALKISGRGQIVPLFALMLAVLMGMAGLAIDVAHARSVAEDAQRAADAAALAGVVYLPGSTSNAETQAAALATANGFTDDGGKTTSIGYEPNTLNRELKVTITQKVKTSFLNVLGFGSITVVRSATATYNDPILMGAPDHMLGFAPYPTNAFAPTYPNTGTTQYPQGFWLEVRGPYTGFEHGDAFSPYFVTNGDKLMTSPSGHAPDNLVDQPNQQCSPYGNPAYGSDPQKGVPAQCFYAYPTATPIPSSTPIFTPTQGHAGFHWPPYTPSATATKQPTPTTIPSATPQPTQAYTMMQNPYYNAQNGGATAGQYGYNYIFTIPPSNKTVLLKVLDPYDECDYGGTGLPSGTTWSSGSGSTSVLAANGSATVSTSTLIDQCSVTGNNWGQNMPTTLRFTVFEPSTRTGDNMPVEPTSTLTGATLGPNGMTVPSNPLVAGADPAYSLSGTSAYGLHRFQWFTLGAVKNSSTRTEYVRISIEAVQDTVTTDAYANSFGNGGNNFALALCTDDSTDTSSMGDLTSTTEWMTADTSGTNPNLHCGDPNTDPTYKAFTVSGASANCPDGSNTCYRVNAREAMCIETLGAANPPSGGTAYFNAIIPLAEVDSHYRNSDLTIRLFDPGDVSLSGSDTNNLGIWGPEVDPKTVNPNFTEPYHLDLSTASGSGYSAAGWQRPAWWAGNSGTLCSGVSDYDADSYQDGGAPICPPLSATGVSTPVTVAQGGNHSLANGTWLQFHMVLPSTYLNGLQAGQDWWKVHYYLTCTSSCSAGDTTTWQVVSGSAPVHLIGQ